MIKYECIDTIFPILTGHWMLLGRKKTTNEHFHECGFIHDCRYIAKI